MTNRAVDNIIDALDKYKKNNLALSSNIQTKEPVMQNIEVVEDTVKNADGTYSNVGDDGESHGKFKTKKKADAQRRAMFANGFHK